MSKNFKKRRRQVRHFRGLIRDLAEYGISVTSPTEAQFSQLSDEEMGQVIRGLQEQLLVAIRSRLNH